MVPEEEAFDHIRFVGLIRVVEPDRLRLYGRQRSWLAGAEVREGSIDTDYPPMGCEVTINRSCGQSRLTKANDHVTFPPLLRSKSTDGKGRMGDAIG